MRIVSDAEMDRRLAGPEGRRRHVVVVTKVLGAMAKVIALAMRR